MAEIAPRVVVEQGVQGGRPVVRGTRVPVAVVVGKLAGGMSVDDVMREYEIDREDVMAALSYAASVIADEQFRAI